MITLEDVSYTYPRGERQAIAGVSVKIEPGECLFITGPSGAGKTTLCMAAAGILEHEYGGEKSGRIAINGRDVKEYSSLSEIAGHVGMVFDDPEAQLLFTSVEEEILSALERRGLRPQEIEERLASIMEVTHLTLLRERPPHALSGGQKQRLVLATTLALGTDIVILDEPTAELDEHGTESIISVLQELKASGKTIIVTEHKFARFRNLVDQMAVMEGGKIRALGRPGNLISDEFVRGVIFPDFSGIRDGKDTSHSGDRGPLVSVKNLEHAYGEVEALKGVSLDIFPGEFVAIVGENGSGKTTLIKHLIWLLRPTKGTVMVDGKDAGKAPVSDLAHSVGLVFQNPDHMFFADTVAEEVMFGIRNLGIQDPEQVLETVLDSTGLSHAKDLYPRWLSRGERQRLAIACVLAMRPRLIILDEPTTGLDGREAREVMEILRDLRQEGRTIVMVTHSRQIAEECTDRIITIDAGKIQSDIRREG